MFNLPAPQWLEQKVMFAMFLQAPAESAAGDQAVEEAVKEAGMIFPSIWAVGFGWVTKQDLKHFIFIPSCRHSKCTHIQVFQFLLAPMEMGLNV